MDGLPNVITTGPTTKIRAPQPDPPSRSTSKKDDGAHTTTLGFGYVNEVGRDGFNRKPFTFPVGTVIVRERLWPGSTTPDQLVVMSKREKSFNRKANGWEFLTVSGDASKILKREQDGKCLKCHKSAGENDFVFPMQNR